MEYQNANLSNTAMEDISLRPSWISCVTATTLLILFHGWIILRFVKYSWDRKRAKGRLNGRTILVIAAVAVTFPIVRYIASLSLLIITLDPREDWRCETVIDSAKAAMSTSLLLIFHFFWFRQRAFYAHPALGHTFGKCAGVMSVASSAIICVTLLITIPLSVFPQEYAASPGGCIFKDGKKLFPFRNYIYGAGVLTCQFILLGLFLHPLRMHKVNAQTSTVGYQKRITYSIPSQTTTSTVIATNDEQAPSPSTVQNDSAAENRSQEQCDMEKKSAQGGCETMNQGEISTSRHRVFRLIRRTLIQAALAVSTDVLAMILIGGVLPFDSPQYVFRLVYDVDLFINIITILGSFENWKVIVFPEFMLTKSKGNITKRRT